MPGPAGRHSTPPELLSRYDPRHGFAHFGDLIEITKVGDKICVSTDYSSWFPTQHYFFNATTTASITVYGNGGNDTIRNYTSTRLVAYGGPGDDQLVGGSGTDSLYGEGENDTLEGRGSNDTLDGGPGWDTYDFGGRNMGADTVYEAGASSTDTLDFSGLMRYVWLGEPATGVALDLSSTAKQDVISSHLTLTLAHAGTISDVIGSGYPDVIRGNDRANDIMGGGGGDELWGMNGNDTIAGGTGDDMLVGGYGDDRLKGEAGVDKMYGGPDYDHLTADRSEPLYTGERISIDDNDLYDPAPLGYAVNSGPNAGVEYLETHGIAVPYDTLQAAAEANHMIRPMEGWTGVTPPDLQVLLQPYKPDVQRETGAEFQRVLALLGSGKPVIALVGVGGVDSFFLDSAPDRLEYVVLNGFDTASETLYSTRYISRSGGGSESSKGTFTFAEFQDMWDWSASGSPENRLAQMGVEKKTILY